SPDRRRAAPGSARQAQADTHGRRVRAPHASSPWLSNMPHPFLTSEDRHGPTPDRSRKTRTAADAKGACCRKDGQCLACAARCGSLKQSAAVVGGQFSRRYHMNGSSLVGRRLTLTLSGLIAVASMI